jgi:hypothetical protein
MICAYVSEEFLRVLLYQEGASLTRTDKLKEGGSGNFFNNTDIEKTVLEACKRAALESTAAEFAVTDSGKHEILVYNLAIVENDLHSGSELSEEETDNYTKHIRNTRRDKLEFTEFVRLNNNRAIESYIYHINAVVIVAFDKIVGMGFAVNLGVNILECFSICEITNKIIT